MSIRFRTILIVAMVFLAASPCLSRQKDERVEKSLQDLVEAIESFNRSTSKVPSKAEAISAINQLSSAMSRTEKEFYRLKKTYRFLRRFQNIPAHLEERFAQLDQVSIKESDNIYCLEEHFSQVAELRVAIAKLERIQRRVIPVLYAVPNHIGRCDRKAIEQYKRELLEGKGNDHDFPMMLAETEDINCVPALIAVLKRHPLFDNGEMICTRAHCLGALRKLTGQNLGNTDEVWENWWAHYQKKQR
jgi:hypothetical protein